MLKIIYNSIVNFITNCAICVYGAENCTHMEKIMQQYTQTQKHKMVINPTHIRLLYEITGILSPRQQFLVLALYQIYKINLENSLV